MNERDYFQQHFERGRNIVRSAPQLYVDFDIETDGKVGYGSMLSLGAITPYGETFYRELKPDSDLWVPRQKEFCEAHNLERERLMEEGMDPKEAIEEFDEWTLEKTRRWNKVGPVVVAHNASFDYPFLALYYEKAGLPETYGVAGDCIKSLAQVFSKNYDWRNTQANRLPADVIPDDEVTHNALEDAVRQQKVHYALVGKIAQLKDQAYKWRQTQKVEDKSSDDTSDSPEEKPEPGNIYAPKPGEPTDLDELRRQASMYREHRSQIHPYRGERLSDMY